MTSTKRFLIPVGAGLAGSIFLTAIYFGIVAWAESLQHAVEFFWQDRWLIFPIIVGFGIQAALYTVLKLRLYIPVLISGSSGLVAPPSAPGASVGASGTTSTIAMAACCAHHLTDVLPILGLTAAATFLGQYRLAFMGVGLGTTLLGIGYMLFILFRARRQSIQFNSISLISKETL
jgi:hypothetical protein